MKNISIGFFVCFIFFSLSSIVMGGPNKQYISAQFSEVMIKNLLNIKMGDTAEEELKNYREWNKEIDEIINKKKLSHKEMKAYLLILFISDVQHKVSEGEHFTEIIIDTIENNRETFFSVLSELTFFMPAVCNRINRHFKSFDTEVEKEQFVEEYNQLILKKLGKKRGTEFLNIIREGKIILD